MGYTIGVFGQPCSVLVYGNAYADPKMYPLVALLIHVRINTPTVVALECVAVCKHTRNGECLSALHMGVWAGICYRLNCAEVDVAGGRPTCKAQVACGCRQG